MNPLLHIGCAATGDALALEQLRGPDKAICWPPMGFLLGKIATFQRVRMTLCGVL